VATNVEQVPERLTPSDSDGRLILAEHYGRYRWAAQLASGKKTLDAGCGTAYGAKLLAEAGASQVVGVDISDQAISEALKMDGHECLDLRHADLANLPFSNQQFDLIVCFEVIEHVQDRAAVLNELRRVLKTDGILCISTPNADVYPAGNPHHVHEYKPEEFARALEELFPYVALHRQGAWLASGVMSETDFSRSGNKNLSANVTKLDRQEPGDEIFTVAIASARELPSTEPIVVLGDPFEVRWWQDQTSAIQERAKSLVNEARRQLHQANRAVLDSRSESRDSTKRLVDVEIHLAGLIDRLHALEEELDARTSRLEALTERVDRADRVLNGMKSSISWRITVPLRALKRLR
jgi:ubiquinone/menaquinone biosynthesis C-methylase UbiE